MLCRFAIRNYNKLYSIFYDFMTWRTIHAAMENVLYCTWLFSLFKMKLQLSLLDQFKNLRDFVAQIKSANLTLLITEITN